MNPYQLFTNSSRQGWRTGVYVQDEYRLSESLLLNAGARLDQNHMITGLQLNPRVGLIWDICSTLTGKFIYSSAFRAPNLFERDANGLGNTPNPNNQQELIKSYEAITEWRPGNGVKLLGTAFHNNLEKVLTQDINSASPTYGMFINIGTYHTYGFEFQAEKKWDNERLLKLSWTHTATQSATANVFSWAPDSPNNLVKFHYAEPLLDNQLRLGFEEIFVDQRRTLGNNIAPAYHLFNINIALTKPLYGFQANLGIYNVLDQRYQIVGGNQNVQDTLAMDGRTARFRLEYGF
jgi:iron complex outermembrane receptor protein